MTANYDSNTISIINVSLDQFGNDSPLFGQAVTVPVGNGPATLTILRDGSRVYVANQKDSTVSVVSLTSYKVLATIPGDGSSYFDCVDVQHSLWSGRMSFLPTSPI